MCGIFGVNRHPQASTLAGPTLLTLGRLAVERGRDSAGLAYVTSAGVSLTRGLGTFPQVVKQKHATRINAAAVTLGHTRWATQGAINDANVSPMPVATLVGTHNGDVAVSTIPGVDALPLPTGTTDTERLYQAIAAASGTTAVVEVLQAVHGRAALAWVDQDTPSRLYLARTALSPLATARDRDGSLYWASNPDWFREADRRAHGAIGFQDITLIAEGTLLVVDTDLAEVIETHEFVPHARAKDEHLLEIAVWRGFTSDDRRADAALFRREVVRPAPVARTPRSVGSWDTWAAPSVQTGQPPLWGDVEVEDDAEEWEADGLHQEWLQEQACEWLIGWVEAGQDRDERAEALEAAAGLVDGRFGGQEAAVEFAEANGLDLDVLPVLATLLDPQQTFSATCAGQV